jgi:hypothetical protein
MALKRHNNGQYTLTSKKQVIKAVKMAKELTAEMERLMAENGITEMQIDATELMRAALAYMEKHELDEIQLGDGRYVKKVGGEYDKRWILDESELAEMDSPDGAISLRTIVKKKFRRDREKVKEVMSRISKRVVDPAGVDEVVADGTLTAEEVEPAYVAKAKRPHLRVYGEANGK